MQLNYKIIGQGKPLIILHGLFGMLDNWQSIAKSLETDFTLYLVDQRNHGKSPHSNEHSYKLMAADLKEFMMQQGISQSNIMGHSMGGKTAMQFALDDPEMVDKLIVVDMGIKRYSGGHDTIFDALQSIKPALIHSRSDAEKQLSLFIQNNSIRQFLLKNLSRSADGNYNWKFNLSALSINYENNILDGITAEIQFEGDTLFLRGSKSDYILNTDWDSIQTLFPAAKLKTVEDAGHWVHADQPEQLISYIKSFLI